MNFVSQPIIEQTLAIGLGRGDENTDGFLSLQPRILVPRCHCRFLRTVFRWVPMLVENPARLMGEGRLLWG